MAEEACQVAREILQRRWLAQGLGESHRSLSLLADGRANGDSGGIPYYHLSLNGIEVAIRQDGMQAWLLSLPAEEVQAEVVALLGEHGLQGVHLAPGGPVQAWVEVSRGRASQPSQVQELVFCLPGRPDQVVGMAELQQVSGELCELLLPERIDRAQLEKTRALAVLPGQIVARFQVTTTGSPGHDVFGRRLLPSLAAAPGLVCPGPGIASSTSGIWQADRYGYLCLVDNQLSVLSPLHLPLGELCAYWVVVDRQPHGVGPEMIGQCLQDQGVVSGIAVERIAQLAELVGQGTCKRGMYIVAQGAAPEAGQETQVEILAKGTLQPWQGRSLLAFAEAVQPEQLIARRLPPKAGQPGRDVKGRLVPAPTDPAPPVQAGKGVRVENAGEGQHFVATTAGTLKLANGELSVSTTPFLAIDGDVDRARGDLDLQGDVCITGSVQRGLSVKVTGDILVQGRVEHGCLVSARGDIAIGGGVLGKQTKIIAHRGSVQAAFIEGATVIAKQNILVGHVKGGRLRAGNRVIVAGRGPAAGTVVGGQVWALRRIDLQVAGAADGTLTSLVVGTDMTTGVSQEQAERMDHLQRLLQQCNRQMGLLLERLGLTQVDPGRIRALIQEATESRQPGVLYQTQQLGRLAQVYQRAQGEVQGIEEQLHQAGELEIRVRDQAHRGVDVRLGGHQLSLADVHQAVRFRVVGGQLKQEDL